MSATVRPIEPHEIPTLLALYDVLRRQNGGEGVLYAPHSAGDPLPPVTHERVQECADRLQRGLDSPDWFRAWVAVTSEGALVGELGLRGGRLPAETHRGTVGMGLIEGYRRHGLGRRLLSNAIAWAQGEPGIRWLDLGVFRGNDRAEALYRSLGFVETGRVADRFRVNGLPVTDIQMALWVGGA